MRPRLIAVSLSLALAASANANEGMWMPSQLPEIAAELREAGFEGDPDDLADLTRAPMNAVVRVGGGTGAFVSGEGLVLTNHHVAFGVIQYNSSAERDLIGE
ncbi:S46 family peptidase, partial [Lysobacter sp. D1-1-M9]|uniref:S46 family peptidase n=1 Tax=Novilysobacter longmucuonensis TaxID=3098603 RepID=UPI002FCBE12C